MSAVNTVLITGTIGDNPKISYFANNDFVVNFSLKNSYIKKGKDGSMKLMTQFFSCSAFSSITKQLEKLVMPGNKVLIAGALRQSSYKDKDGEFKSSVQISVDTITVFGTREKENEYE